MPIEEANFHAALRQKGMITMHTCALCNYKFEAESPAILFVDRYTRRRPLCEECEALLDKATEEGDSPEKTEALHSLSAIALKMKDPEAMQVLRDVLDGKTSAEETEQDIADEEAWNEINEEETEAENKNIILDYVIPGIICAAALGVFVWFCFFR